MLDLRSEHGDQFLIEVYGLCSRPSKEDKDKVVEESRDKTTENSDCGHMTSNEEGDVESNESNTQVDQQLTML